MDTILCPKCGNTVPKNQKICIYCQAPLSKPKVKTNWQIPSKSKIRLFGLALIIISYVVFTGISDLVNFFRGDTKAASSVSKPVAKKPAIEEKKLPVETSALAAYTNLTKAIESDDEETAKRYVKNATWNALELEQTEPSAVRELNPRCDVEKKFESHDLDDRAVITASGKSDQVKDDEGKPVLTVLIVKMAKEDEQWKVFSYSCRTSPPADYMEEALTWLYEQPAGGDDLNSKLIANGLRDGEVDCFMAVERGNPKAVKRCLEAGWSVDAEDSDGHKAIDLALAKMDYALPQNNEVIDLFVKEGVNVNRPNSEGMTPLMLAAIHCDGDAAKLFIDAGADMDYKNPDGITPSKLAENCPQVTKLLRAVKNP